MQKNDALGAHPDVTDRIAAIRWRCPSQRKSRPLTQSAAAINQTMAITSCLWNGRSARHAQISILQRDSSRDGLTYCQ
jgi:hypothetical protein